MSNLPSPQENAHARTKVLRIEAENARLKAEVDEARRGSGAGMRVVLDLNNQLVAENDRLKAEVERLTNLQSGADYFKAKEGKPSV